MSEIIRKTIDYLNATLDSDYTYDSAYTINLITTLTNKGYGFQDFKKVIDLKYKQWKGTKYEVYIRPTTLFGKNFENYVNEQPIKTSIERLRDSVNRAKLTNWKLDKR